MNESVAIKSQFMKWQCRVRQMAMREQMGQPNEAIAPELFQFGSNRSSGRIITLLSKEEDFSQLYELQHLVHKTYDPSARRSSALQFLCASYFQRFEEFDDRLTALFAPQASEFTDLILQVQKWILAFKAYGHEFYLSCKAQILPPDDYLFQASWWHNHLFNPDLQKQCKIIAFTPDWQNSSNSFESFFNQENSVM